MQMFPGVMGVDEMSWEKCVHEKRRRGQTPGKFIFKGYVTYIIDNRKNKEQNQDFYFSHHRSSEVGFSGLVRWLHQRARPSLFFHHIQCVFFILKFASIIKWPHQVPPSHFKKQGSGRGQPSEPAFKEVFPEDPPHNFCLHQPELSHMTYLQGRLGNVVLQLDPLLLSLNQDSLVREEGRMETGQTTVISTTKGVGRGKKR